MKIKYAGTARTYAFGKYKFDKKSKCEIDVDIDTGERLLCRSDFRLAETAVISGEASSGNEKVEEAEASSGNEKVEEAEAAEAGQPASTDVSDIVEDLKHIYTQEEQPKKQTKSKKQPADIIG